MSSAKSGRRASDDRVDRIDSREDILTALAKSFAGRVPPAKVREDTATYCYRRREQAPLPSARAEEPTLAGARMHACRAGPAQDATTRASERPRQQRRGVLVAMQVVAVRHDGALVMLVSASV